MVDSEVVHAEATEAADLVLQAAEEVDALGEYALNYLRPNLFTSHSRDRDGPRSGGYGDRDRDRYGGDRDRDRPMRQWGGPPRDRDRDGPRRSFGGFKRDFDGGDDREPKRYRY